MYRLMKPERLVLDHVVSGILSSYRQTEVDHFERFPAALQACQLANKSGDSRHYILNESSQGYHQGAWID